MVPKWILMNLPLQEKKMMLCTKLGAHKKEEIEIITQTCFLWHFGLRKPFCDQETYKARRVVIPHSLGIAKGLQQGVGTDDLIF